MPTVPHFERSVHPRVGGEHVDLRTVRPAAHERFIPAWAGNTLRLGKSGDSVRAPIRFIPAWAGNTGSNLDRVEPATHTVHPRVGGEHPSDIGPRDANVWSRFIPAWAGNTRP